MLVPIFSCAEQMTLHTLQHLLKDEVGLVYLQDQQYPVFAFLPKTIQILPQQHTWQRQADFSYQIITQPTPLPAIFSTATENATQGFCGGYIGFFSYDFCAGQWISLQNHGKNPQAIIGEYDILLKKIQQQWQLWVNPQLVSHPYIEKIIRHLQQVSPVHFPVNLTLATPLLSRWTKAQYAQAFQQVQHYLHAGDCYQINLTQEFYSTIIQGDLYSLLQPLLDLTDAPFSAYLKWQDFELLSCSPELFIAFEAQRKMRTEPIKGTLPRHCNPRIDRQQKQKLAQSEKDQAENLMIVDLLRNDFSVYAETGSVKVPQLFTIQSFAQVHHMVSEIQATLKADSNLYDVLLASLPGGSITGAPKIRAMQIIAELEQQNRGAYCGSLGYFNHDGTGRFNILIRTLQRYSSHLSLWAGGGITVASDMDAEYQECLDKVSALLTFLNQYSI